MAVDSGLRGMRSMSSEFSPLHVGRSHPFYLENEEQLCVSKVLEPLNGRTQAQLPPKVTC